MSLLLYPQEGAKYCDGCVCLSVCLSVQSHNSKTTFCACFLWPWLGPPLTALRYAMYFRFFGCSHIFIPWSQRSESSMMLCLDVLAGRQIQENGCWATENKIRPTADRRNICSWWHKISTLYINRITRILIQDVHAVTVLKILFREGQWVTFLIQCQICSVLLLMMMITRSIWKMLGPFATASRRTP